MSVRYGHITHYLIEADSVIYDLESHNMLLTCYRDL